MTTPNNQYIYVSAPQTGNSTRTAGQAGQGTGSQGTAGSGGTSRTGGAQSPARSSNQVKIPAGLPHFLGNRQTIFAAWFAAMVLIGFDEWHNYHMLPRPSRFWYTSLTYGILALMGFIDALVPLLNALAIGYTIMLAWQYYNGSGQFGKTSGRAS